MKAAEIKELFNSFESIAIEYEDVECRSGRELSLVLGYSQYRNFLPVIEIAKESCSNAEFHPKAKENNKRSDMKKLFYFMILSCFALLQSSCNTHKQTSSLYSKVENESEIFSDPEQQPYYLNGGNKGLLNDLYTTLLKTAPVAQECVKARAVVRFSISENGNIDPNSIKIVTNKSVPEDYMTAAIEAIKKLGNFEPGKMNGTPIKVTYNLPIIYPVPLDKINTENIR